MALREIRGIRVEELDLSKPLLNRARRSMPRKDYLAMQNLKRPKLEPEKEKPCIKQEEKEQSTRRSKRVRRQSVWLADSEIDLDSELDPDKKPTDFGRRFPCTYCGVALSSLGALNDHMLVHTEAAKSSVVPGKHVCPKCHKSFPKSGKLQKHLNNVHAKRDFKCEMCSRHFSSKYSLLLHWQGKICHYFNIDD